MPSLTGREFILQYYWREDMAHSAIRLTSIGGIAVKLYANEALVEGEVVRASTWADEYVKKTSAGDDMPVGVTYADASSGAVVWVVVAGIGYVLPEANVTATRGYVIYCDAEAGRVAQAAALPILAKHNCEVGHFIETALSGGTKAKAIIHWN